MVPKFRAWDKNNNEMISWRYLLNGYNLRNVFMRPEMCGLVLMQFTGLKDKNSVEIFEGDVLKNTRNGKIRRVHWNPSCASFHLSKHGIEESKVEYWSLSNPQWSYEIIGNIYENPELLEQADEN